MTIHDAQIVRAEYETETRLQQRSLYRWAIYEGPDPREHALLALHEARPRRLLDAGCGTGEFAERASRVLGCEVVGVDQSERMATLTRARGIDAVVADAAALPFPDASFDAVSANWMLYHLPDLDAGLAALARVVRPAGRLVAIANGERHLEELWGTNGGTFTAENGEALLSRHFARVERRDVRGAALFTNRAALRAYLSGFEVLHGRDETQRADESVLPLRATCHNVVFVADRASA